MKTRVAVFFGGRSPEHDVSVVTGLQAYAALDNQRFEAFPVYIALDGEWLVGESLSQRSTYIPGPEERKRLLPVTLDIGRNSAAEGLLIEKDSGGLFSKPQTHGFDVALLAFHGVVGEDGGMQGLFEAANIPYTGMRLLASTVLMDKAKTKAMLSDTGVPSLPHRVIDRPAEGLLVDPATLEEALTGLAYPVIAKPNHLGSSIGVASAEDTETLRNVLATIFRLDRQAIIEPFVPNLVEYNVAVARLAGEIRTSAIERPKRSDELLDFKQKYMSGDGGGGKKQAGASGGEGMLSLTRDINPQMPKQSEDNIRQWATACFERMGAVGAPRIDFLSDFETGEFWFNEANPCPGSFGYFLWEASTENPLLFTELLSHLVDEALGESAAEQLPPDPTLPEARLFQRR